LPSLKSLRMRFWRAICGISVRLREAARLPCARRAGQGVRPVIRCCVQLPHAVSDRWRN